MENLRADVTQPPVISPLPEAVTRAARLRRENRMAEAMAVVESALTHARSALFDVPFRNRVLLALTLADLYVLADRRHDARRLLAAEIPFAECVFELIRQSGTPAQIHAAGTGVRQLRDRAVQLALLGQPAPELVVAEWVCGSPTTIEAQRGRVVLVEFWAPRCRSCASMFPFFDGLHSRYADHGLTVLALTRYRSNGDRTSERDVILQTVAEHDIPFRVGIAPDEQLQQRYGANGIPTFVVIDRAGVVRLATSKPDRATLEHEIARLLDAVTVPTP
jgi:thiol-disulfide isomerase/thioredoxin